MATSKMTKTDKLLKALYSGENVSVKALRKATGLVNISSTVHRLNEEFGEDAHIYLNRRRASNGRIVNFYRYAS